MLKMQQKQANKLHLNTNSQINTQYHRSNKKESWVDNIKIFLNKDIILVTI